MKRLIYFILLLLPLCWMSCDDYDKWTLSKNARLEFSVDTLSFDTVISTHSSSTKNLLVWNRNKEGIRISRVAFRNGAASHFRANVDGQFLAGGTGDDFEIRGGDSLFVRLEVKLPASDLDSPVDYEDELLFYMENGSQQSVKLMASALDVYTIKGQVIDKDTTFKAGRPYLVYDSLVVKEGATLMLEPGVCLMFHDSVSLHVHGKLLAEGTIDKPVIFRGDRLDRLFDNLPYDNTSNRWGGIHFYEKSSGNVMSQCDVHSGQYGVLLDSLCVDVSGEVALTMKNCVIHNVEGDAFHAQDSKALVIGTQISNSLGNTVSLLGGSYTFVHCTIAQYYPWSYNCGDALYLANTTNPDDESASHMLHNAYFLNCVIMGRAEDVVMGNIEEYQDYRCNYQFNNCYIRTVESMDDDRFVNVVYDKDTLNVKTDEFSVGRYGSANFAVIGVDYLFNFTPDSLSAIRGLADIAVLKQYECTFDRRGVGRLADGAPDAGAYEFVPNN